jgi:biotin operon repressor
MTETSMERLLRLADGTRTPVELAALLGISRSRVHQLMVKLRGRGVEVPVRKTGARNGMQKCPAIPAPA